MRPKGSSQLLEWRRHRAIELLEAGQSFRQVAFALDASVSSIQNWSEKYRAGGLKALHVKPAPGRPPRLNPSQQEKLQELLSQGAQAFGFPNEMWTTVRIAKVIRERFGVKYSTAHVWKLMTCKMVWSWQMPEPGAGERDKAEIECWKKKLWPRIKKSQRMPRTPVFLG